MQYEAIKLKVEVDAMRQQLLHHLTGYEDLIKQAIADAVTPDNLMQQVTKQINDTLAWKIGLELNALVSNAVRDSKDLKVLIDRAVDTYLKGHNC